MYTEMLKLVERYRKHGMFVVQMGMIPFLIIFQAEYMQVSKLYSYIYTVLFLKIFFRMKSFILFSFLQYMFIENPKYE